ncbi:CGNR zinc finger domain-containing protein [Rhodococcoides kyotonense]|uniref:Putative stress-induced transcription regulator n=1 Tax=Rhodococcoides kyotonense TaxID=398843 RepID=A0A239FK91_9NOCA|nr:CGNR zinc finger domain-containing protein [Rhodococcus kyotonensis]SNS57171.1 Putative stress-induced transcription regulator [Rhodococcus kyotonensis]
MVFTHDTECALVSAVFLANSAEDPDTLDTCEQLREFYRSHDYTGRLDGDQAELDSVRSLRPRLRQLLTSDRDAAVDIVNQILSDANALPRLVRHGDTDWHLHAVSDDHPFAVRIAVESAMAMIDVIRADELSRLQICAADCDGIVLDLSRNRSRKFCSTACGNRTAVAAYRTRKSSR